MLYYLHFLNAFIHHLHLLSFPTRRSSDLLPDPQARAPHRVGHPALLPRLVPELKRQHRHHQAEGKRHERGGERSEEHTSELQSRGHLVCRLLLEKKKKTKTRPTTLLKQDK